MLAWVRAQKIIYKNMEVNNNDDFAQSVKEDERNELVAKEKAEQKTPIIKETDKSLKYYFIVIGILIILNFLSILRLIPELLIQQTIIGAFRIIDLLIGIIFLIIGLNFTKIIPAKATSVVKFLYVSLILYCAYYIYLIVVNFNIVSIFITLIFGLIEIIITLYLIRQIKRIKIL